MHILDMRSQYNVMREVNEIQLAYFFDLICPKPHTQQLNIIFKNAPKDCVLDCPMNNFWYSWDNTGMVAKFGNLNLGFSSI